MRRSKARRLARRSRRLARRRKRGMKKVRISRGGIRL